MSPVVDRIPVDRIPVDRIPITHVGSLPRSQDVLDALIAMESDAGMDSAAFDAVMCGAVREVVARQREAGIDVVSDGEQSKASYANYIRHRLSGFGDRGPAMRGADLADFPGFFARLKERKSGALRLHRPCCVGPVAVRDEAPLRADIERFKAALADTGSPHGFMNAASPGVIAVFQPNRYYPTQADYLEALGAAMRAEYQAIAEAGVQLQIDCPDLAMARHLVYADLSDDEFLAHAATQVEVLNHALAGIAPARVRMHLCWGNYEGPHHRDIPLEKIFALVMKVNAGTLLFEAANPRHAHEWQVFREFARLIPEDKVLVPGVISSTSNYIEHPRLIAERLLHFADIVGRERVMAGSDCGFSTFAGDGLVDPDICYAKFRAMAEGAAMAGDQLWGRNYTARPVRPGHIHMKGLHL
jgi:5-methyltetrahydropteroyltriglutamate--homocysteine methyltransferase